MLLNELLVGLGVVVVFAAGTIALLEFLELKSQVDWHKNNADFYAKNCNKLYDEIKNQKLDKQILNGKIAKLKKYGKFRNPKTGRYISADSLLNNKY